MFLIPFLLRREHAICAAVCPQNGAVCVITSRAVHVCPAKQNDTIIEEIAKCRFIGGGRGGGGGGHWRLRAEE